MTLVTLIAACDVREQAPDPGQQSTEQAGAAAQPPELIQDGVPLVTAGQGWLFRREVNADLNADGRTERAVLISNVRMQRGRPVWEDGHHWQLYIEDGDGTVSHVYSRFVPLGLVEARLTDSAADSTRSILILERTPHSLGAFEIRYLGPGSWQAVELFTREFNPSHDFVGSAP